MAHFLWPLRCHIQVSSNIINHINYWSDNFLMFSETSKLVFDCWVDKVSVSFGLSCKAVVRMWVLCFRQNLSIWFVYIFSLVGIWSEAAMCQWALEEFTQRLPPADRALFGRVPKFVCCECIIGQKNHVLWTRHKTQTVTFPLNSTYSSLRFMETVREIEGKKWCKSLISPIEI